MGQGAVRSNALRTAPVARTGDTTVSRVKGIEALTQSGRPYPAEWSWLLPPNPRVHRGFFVSGGSRL